MSCRRAYPRQLAFQGPVTAAIGFCLATIGTATQPEDEFCRGIDADYKAPSPEPWKAPNLGYQTAAENLYQ